MTVLIHGLARRGAERLRALAYLPVAGAVAYELGRMVTSGAGLRLALAAAAIIAGAAICVRSPRLAVFVVLAWLAVLGLVRLTVFGVGAASTFDTLLLVAPVATGLLAVGAMQQGAMADRDRLASWVLGLQVAMVLGAVNPLQGSPKAGFGGLMLLLVPTLWFWIGRGLLDDRLAAWALGAVVVLSVVAVGVGLRQTYSGLTDVEQAYLQSKHLASASVGGVLRAFGIFSSPSEYAEYIGVALVVLISVMARRGRWLVLLPVAGLIGWALLLESSRGAVLLTALAAGLALGLARGARVTTMAVGAGAAAAVLYVSAGHLAHVQFTGDRTGPLLSHQFQGIADPLNGQTSTAGTHAGMVASGLSSIVHAPLGSGTGVITTAASKFGADVRGSEADVSNAAIAWGLPGLVLYLGILLMGVRRLYEAARRRRDALSVVMFAIVVVTFQQWLNGQNYAAVVLPWLALGWASRSAGGAVGTPD